MIRLNLGHQFAKTLEGAKICQGVVPCTLQGEGMMRYAHFRQPLQGHRVRVGGTTNHFMTQINEFLQQFSPEIEKRRSVAGYDHYPLQLNPADFGDLIAQAKDLVRVN